MMHTVTDREDHCWLKFSSSHALPSICQLAKSDSYALRINFHKTLDKLYSVRYAMVGNVVSAHVSAHNNLSKSIFVVFGAN